MTAPESVTDPYLFVSNSDSEDDTPTLATSLTAETPSCSYGAAAATAVRWLPIRIGDAILEVSTEGQIKKAGVFEPASDGLPYPGTPYRVARIQHGATPHDSSLFFIHDLVYQTFIGLPPPGWNVRHRSGTHNALRNLTILPATATRDPVLSAY